MQSGPRSHESVSQVVSDDVSAEGAVVEESSVVHDVARPGEAVGQLVGVARLTCTWRTQDGRTFVTKGPTGVAASQQ